jgi:hypothetical protein
MDPYKARQDVTEKMLLELLEAQSLNSDICDSETKPKLYNCEERWREMAWKVLYLSNS